MKTFAKLMFGLSAAAAMTACSSTEEVNAPAAKGDVTVTVITSDAMISRAGIAAVPGYDFKCVMQLVGNDGETVGAQAIEDASAGSASFTIKAADIDAGATKAIFWAEYVPTAGAAKVYNSTDLKDITYAVTAFDMTDADLMAAADAFAGTITTLENGAKATLSRPMIQFNFKPTNPEAAAGETSFTVSYEATSGYNVLTGNCSTTYQELTYTDAAFDPAKAGNWFTSMIFAPANLPTFDRDITMSLSGVRDMKLTIPAGKLPMDPNYIVNTTGEITQEPEQEINVTVSVNGNFENEPKPATFEVGAYVDAAGQPVSAKEDAVGVVFHVGAIDGDDASLYPAAFAGKTVKGYVVAFENVAAARKQVNENLIPDGLTPCENLINGSVQTATLLAACGNSPLVEAWNDWTAAHTLAAAGSATTDWYVPARIQFEQWIAMLMPTNNLKGELVEIPSTDAFKALFPTSNLFDRENLAPVMYLTCSINSGGNIQGATLKNGEPVSFSQIDIKTKTNSALCRAMFTVFE